MLLSRGDPFVFISPSSRSAWASSSPRQSLLIIIALPALRKKREEVFVEET